jgi:hypothetical protein
MEALLLSWWFWLFCGAVTVFISKYCFGIKELGICWAIVIVSFGWPGLVSSLFLIIGLRLLDFCNFLNNRFKI